MITTVKPARNSLWRDEVLNITYRVIGVDMLSYEALVICRHANRSWNDTLHLSLFGTEVKEIV
jgi:hypothetical protein